MTTRIIMLCLTLVFSGWVPTVRAESAASIRQRMEQRLASLDRLKAEGVIGENNRGFVEIRSGDEKAASVVADENRDREAVYALIAKETSVSADAVGLARAKQIAAHSRRGVWVQDEAGTWTKK